MTTTSTTKPPRPLGIRDVPDAVDVIVKHGCRPGDLQRLLGLSQPYVTRARAAGLPRLASGRHSVASVVNWIRERDRERSPVGPVADGDGSVELERWRRARADLAELDLLRRRGEVVEREEVVDFATTAIVAVRQRLSDLVRKMAVRLFQAPSVEWIEGQLRTEVDSLCRGFQNGLERTHSAGDGSEEPNDEAGTLLVNDENDTLADEAGADTNED